MAYGMLLKEESAPKKQNPDEMKMMAAMWTEAAKANNG
jgi:hypothetical protein